MKIRQAVILAGGLGTRLRPLTDNIPKPMIPIHGRPFLEYIIEELRSNEVEEVVLLLGYLPEKIVTHFGDGSRFGVRIRYSVGEVEWDTGTRIRSAKEMLDDRFLLLYGDNYWPLPLAKLARFYEEHHAPVSVCIYSNRDQYTKSNMKVDGEGFVTAYDKSPPDSELSGVDIGFFIVDKSIFAMMPEHDFSFQKTIIPPLIAQRRLAGFVSEHKYYTLSDHKRLPGTEEALRPRRVVFLDRDGVINVKAPKADYVKSWEEFRFLPGAIEAIRLLSETGWEIYIISNQPGIARGVMTREALDDIHARMLEEISRGGGTIASAYYCMHGWNDGCDCRKPRPGMLFQAAREHRVILPHAVFIGDDERDAQAGEAAGVPTILIDEKTSLLDEVRALIAGASKPQIIKEV